MKIVPKSCTVNRSLTSKLANVPFLSMIVPSRVVMQVHKSYGVTHDQISEEGPRGCSDYESTLRLTASH